MVFQCLFDGVGGFAFAFEVVGEVILESLMLGRFWFKVRKIHSMRRTTPGHLL